MSSLFLLVFTMQGFIISVKLLMKDDTY